MNEKDYGKGVQDACAMIRAVSFGMESAQRDNLLADFLRQLAERIEADLLV